MNLLAPLLIFLAQASMAAVVGVVPIPSLYLFWAPLNPHTGERLRGRVKYKYWPLGVLNAPDCRDAHMHSDVSSGKQDSSAAYGPMV